MRAHADAGEEVLIVGATREAADDLARSIAVERGATVGLHRFSLAQLAARLAAPILAAERTAASTYLASEAVAARATFEASRDGALDYFLPVAGTPGFPRALARTLNELRLAGVAASSLAALPLGGPDLSALLERFDEQFASASAIDRATLMTTAAAAVTGTRERPLVLLDVPLDSAIEFQFVRALLEASSAVIVTVPFGDLQALERLESLGLVGEVLEQKGESDLVALRRHLFASTRPPSRERAGDVRFFSAPGEGREAVEIARRILEESRRGVPFDEMAVLVRSPERYVGLLEHAFARVGSRHDGTLPEPDAGIPAWFERGTRRPHPSGRALLAILACACEKLSARRFAEYLSLAQVPKAALKGRATDDAHATEFDVSDDAAVVDGSLRAPWKWETLIVESAVIGGDSARWHRRLDGMEKEYRVRIQEETKEDAESPRARGIARDLRNLQHLRSFALPIVDRLASWPAAATWGEWLDRLFELSPLVLRQPDRVLEVLKELRPMAAIGPVTLAEARDVLAERLRLLEVEPPRQRYGRVFVGGPQHARGRTFRVVFVPGLAERMFPQKPHEDPMLLDKELREPLDAGLALQLHRGRTERLLLRLAAGAATERLWLSYPRIDMAESRPRVPSFYALDVMRAITGAIPNHEELQERAAIESEAHLAWPSPADPARAIDDFEHDLAVLRQLLRCEIPPKVRGHAHYLLRLNESLKRSVTARWARGRSQWTPYDGITRLTATTTPLLAKHRLGARPYSLSALQKYSSCPYQFLLSAVHRLQPAEEPEPLQRLDPLTRGALFHEAQAMFFRARRDEGGLPVTHAGLDRALAVLDAVTQEIGAKYHEQLAPAIERVWQDEMADIARDLRVWARRLPDTPGWIPEYFEFSFGLSDEGRDPRSTPDPVMVDGRFRLRGAIDLIERTADGSLLRVTDHKTGKNRTTDKTVIGGGGILQPVLYSLAVEQALSLPVVSGRLFYCTAAGGFTEREIPINDATRRAGVEALEIVDRAIELGFLPAAPNERACVWCDFRAVCGPHEEQRVARKSADKLADLHALRGIK